MSRRLLIIVVACVMGWPLLGAVCDGQPLDSTRDVIMDFSNIERSTDVCLNHYHGSPQVIGTTYICKHVEDYPIYGITPGYP